MHLLMNLKRKKMKQNLTLTFKDVYHLPLHIDGFCPIYVFSANRVMTFDILLDDIDKVQEILNVINGKSDIHYVSAKYDDGYILVDGKPIFLIRGWGYLTGVGALNLPYEIASKIQDDFCNFIVNRLS